MDIGIFMNTRNSKVVDIIDRFKEFGISPVIIDPVADKNEAKSIYGVDIMDMEMAKDADCIIFVLFKFLFTVSFPL